MTSETLLVILGAVVSLLFSYVPGLATWYNPLDETKKKLIMAGLLAVITGVIFGLSCTSLFTWVQCTQEGAIGLVTAFIFALMANQATNSLSPRVGLKSPVTKNVVLTTSSGGTTSVGLTELGTTSDIQPLSQPKG